MAGLRLVAEAAKRPLELRASVSLKEEPQQEAGLQQDPQRALRRWNLGRGPGLLMDYRRCLMPSGSLALRWRKVDESGKE